MVLRPLPSVSVLLDLAVRPLPLLPALLGAPGCISSPGGEPDHLGFQACARKS